MRKNILIPILLFALALSLTLASAAVPAQAQAPDDSGAAVAEDSFESDWGQSFQTGSLDLSDEQMARLKELRESFRKEQVQARADLRVQQMELRELMMAENPDRAAIAGKLDAIAAARTAQTLARFDHRQQMLSVLTPEQRDQLKTMRQERRSARRFDRRGRRGGRGFGHGFGRRGRNNRRWDPRGNWDCPCGMGPGRGDGPPPTD